MAEQPSLPLSDQIILSLDFSNKMSKQVIFELCGLGNDFGSFRGCLVLPSTLIYLCWRFKSQRRRTGPLYRVLRTPPGALKYLQQLLWPIFSSFLSLWVTREKLKDFSSVQLSWERKPEVSLTATDVKMMILLERQSLPLLSSPSALCARKSPVSMINHR